MLATVQGLFSNVAVGVFLCLSELTSSGFMVMFYSRPPLHFHHTPLNAAVADVTEVLSDSLHTLSHKVSGCGNEAALTLLKVLVVLHLWGRFIFSIIPNVLRHNLCVKRCLNWNSPQRWYAEPASHVSSQACLVWRLLCPASAYGSCQNTAPGGHKEE